MTNEEALAKTHELYDFVRSKLDVQPSDISDAHYRALRKELLDGVGLEALPGSVRKGRTIDDCLRNVIDDTALDGDRRQTLKQDFDPLFDFLESGRADAAPRSELVAPETKLDIFISHSSADKALADALVALLRLSMLLRPEQIRCTSVEGTGLGGGVRFEERLREEIAASRVFIALITPALLRSHFSLFELGARWGLDVFGAIGGVWMPVVARGIDRGRLPAPLSQRHALDLSVRSEADSFLVQVAKILGKQLTERGTDDQYIARVISEASKVPAGRGEDDLSMEERRVLRALFDEEVGRFLNAYRQNYGDAITGLLRKEYIREIDGKLTLRSRGAAVVREYLLAHLD